MRVDIVERTDTYVVATWRRIMLLVWRGQPRAAGIDRSRALFQPWAERIPGGAAFLVVVPPHPSGPPDEETRSAMSRSMEDRPPALLGVGRLLEAEGFIAAAVRALMTRLHQKNAHGKAPNMFGKVEEAASWAAELLGDREITPAGLADAIRAAREQ